MSTCLPVEREAVSISEACAVIGIGRTKLYQAIKEGRLVACKIGNRTVIRLADLRAFIASLPSAA
jgi:excisionase family DNA binding protein